MKSMQRSMRDLLGFGGEDREGRWRIAIILGGSEDVLEIGTKNTRLYEIWKKGDEENFKEGCEENFEDEDEMDGTEKAEVLGGIIIDVESKRPPRLPKNIQKEIKGTESLEIIDMPIP